MAAADAGGRVGDPAVSSVAALGERGYWGLLRVADAMLGNSSSGLIEAPAVGLPVVNVGDRQAGRRREAERHRRRRRTRRPWPRRSAGRWSPAFRAGLAGRSTRGSPTVGPGRESPDIIAAWQPSRPPRKPPVRVGP